MTKEQLLSILKHEVVPSLGVTEPGAVAMCCSAASGCNTVDTRKIQLTVSPNIYKNCMSVGIPGFEEKGIAAAAALGAIGGDYKLGLEALSRVTAENAAACRKLLDENGVEVSISDNGELLYIEARCAGDSGTGRCIVRKGHANIALIERNGITTFIKEEADDESEEDPVLLKNITVKELVECVEEITAEELSLLREGADMNRKASEWGLSHRPGMGVGGSLADLKEQGVIAEDLLTELQTATCAASDVRVSGSFVSVMTCAGSGNHGIMAIVPVNRAAELLQASDEKTLRALALSCLITVYVKNYSGKLSGMCGCGVASATGVAAALTYLMGGTAEQVENSIKNMAGDITGMICDGAKAGCSLKLATAVSSAVRAATFAVRGITVPDDNGIIAATAEQTMRNMGDISARGMSSTDHVILDVMQHHKC